MDLQKYRASASEQEREKCIRSLLPADANKVLDIGARDGVYSMLFAERYEAVVALDLEKPKIEHPKIECVKGDVTCLEFMDKEFDFVFCAEVLEHIPPKLLKKACDELARVCNSKLLIGVPFEQDTRSGRTTCINCGCKNPPWGHVNIFDLNKLVSLFPTLKVETVKYAGRTRNRTNAVCTSLLDYAGNPFGTYVQDEPCIECGNKLEVLASRTLLQRIATRLAYYIQVMQNKFFTKERAYWIHVLFSREE